MEKPTLNIEKKKKGTIASAVNSNFLTLNGFRSGASFQDLLLHSHVLYHFSEISVSDHNPPRAAREQISSIILALLRFLFSHFAVRTGRSPSSVIPYDGKILLSNYDHLIELDGTIIDSRYLFGCNNNREKLFAIPDASASQAAYYFIEWISLGQCKVAWAHYKISTQCQFDNSITM
jgi:hypothetical protein